jgi:hypothetical protein
MNLGIVIAGLDPAIHRAVPHLLRVSMDARVKPGHDEENCASGGHPSPTGGEGKRRVAR